jgi:hypothetical protein
VCMRNLIIIVRQRMQVVKLVVNLWGSRFFLSHRASSALFVAEILDRQKVAGSEVEIERKFNGAVLVTCL